jgi:hypothetical protein
MFSFPKRMNMKGENIELQIWKKNFVSEEEIKEKSITMKDWR